jgi:hypothetical protein
MKRIAMVALLLAAGAFGAHADNDIYLNTMKQPRSDAELQVDTNTCNQTIGAPKNGTTTSRQYKRCMASRGWRFQRTQRTPPEHTWIDDEGLTCRDLKIGNSVIGSSCSNF